MAYPYTGITCPVDVTALLAYVKQYNLSSNIATIYILARAANGIAEFRTRLRGETVVEHTVVHPSPTVPTADEQFSFSHIAYSEDFASFSGRAAESIAVAQANPSFKDPAGRDDFLFMTAMPWISFTSMLHPVPLYPSDSVPRMAWGKYYSEGERVRMPLNVQGHHALMDGRHIGRFVQDVEALLADPAATLGAG